MPRWNQSVTHNWAIGRLWLCAILGVVAGYVGRNLPKIFHQVLDHVPA